MITAGGIAAVATTAWFHIDSSYLLLLGGIGLVLTAVFNPEGIAGETRRAVLRLVDRLRPRKSDPPQDQQRVAPTPDETTKRRANGTNECRPDPQRGRALVAPLLKVERMSVRYGGVRALTDVSLDVPAGKIIGLIGPNGAGKTTLLDAVTGFADALVRWR